MIHKTDGLYPFTVILITFPKTWRNVWLECQVSARNDGMQCWNHTVNEVIKILCMQIYVVHLNICI